MESMIKTLRAGIFGILYFIFGITMAVSVIVPGIGGITEPFMIPADIIAGCVLCVVGAVYLSALCHFMRESGNGPAFLDVATMLSVIFGAVALLSRGTQGLDLLIFKEAAWSPLSLLVPMVWLAILPGAVLLWQRQNFTGRHGKET
jgi:hypothetical protein